MLTIILGLLVVLLLAGYLYLIFRKMKYDGKIIVSYDEVGKKIFTLELEKDPGLIETSEHFILKVVPEYDDFYSAG